MGYKIRCHLPGEVPKRSPSAGRLSTNHLTRDPLGKGASKYMDIQSVEVHGYAQFASFSWRRQRFWLSQLPKARHLEPKVPQSSPCFHSSLGFWKQTEKRQSVFVMFASCALPLPSWPVPFPHRLFSELILSHFCVHLILFEYLLLSDPIWALGRLGRVRQSFSALTEMTDAQGSVRQSARAGFLQS